MYSVDGLVTSFPLKTKEKQQQTNKPLLLSTAFARAVNYDYCCNHHAMLYRAVVLGCGGTLLYPSGQTRSAYPLVACVGFCFGSV